MLRNSKIFGSKRRGKGEKQITAKRNLLLFLLVTILHKPSQILSSYLCELSLMEETQQATHSLPFNGTVTLESSPCYSPSLSLNECENTNSPRIDKSAELCSVDREAIDSMILVCGPRLIRSGFWEPNCLGGMVFLIFQFFKQESVGKLRNTSSKLVYKKCDCCFFSLKFSKI